jgi:chromosome segregation protein
MRLKAIKLAGFKSFVDPTTVSLPGKTCAVVGPNGCGKSNIIDAVRWVMGESSARQLRGEALTDVIFNGSSTRQPTAMASVELLFDNSDARIGGAYASYGEIAIRREVARDAQSAYYLNGNRCRRRDVMDIFLGTGFGPRSYSIIEQGMISQLVEAKPEELRNYLEEAAGISKYRERRRETENRIKHTVENLDRLNDIRDELDRQLAHLKRQSRNAEKYRQFREEERGTTAALYTIKLRALEAGLAVREEKLSELELENERNRTELQSLDTSLEKARAEQSETTDKFNDTQGKYYKLGADIARLEEGIQFNQERIAQLGQDRKGVVVRQAETATQLEMDDAEILSLQEGVLAKKPEVEAVEVDFERVSSELTANESSVIELQRSWDEFSARASANDAEIHVQESRVEHLDQVLLRLRARRDQLDTDHPGSGSEAFSLRDLAEQVEHVQGTVNALAADFEACIEALRLARDNVVERERSLEEARISVQAMRHELASLSALQQATLGGEGTETDAWLVGHGLSEALRIRDGLKVTAGWERAVEVALGKDLMAVGVDDITTFADKVTDLAGGEVTLYQASSTDDHSVDELRPLSAYVEDVDASLGGLLDGIFAAESMEEAVAARTKLRPGESVILANGVWFGRDWLRFRQVDKSGQGVIERGRALEVLEREVEDAEARLAELQEDLTLMKNQVQTFETERDGLQTRQAEFSNKLSSVKTDHGVNRVREEEAVARRTLNKKEQRELESQIKQESAKLEESRFNLISLVAEADQLRDERDELTRSRDRGIEQLESARGASNSVRDYYHTLKLEYQSLESSLQACENARRRLMTQRGELDQRLQDIDNSLSDNERPLPTFKTQLESVLSERKNIDGELSSVRDRMEVIDGEITMQQAKRQDADTRIEETRRRLEERRIDREGVVVKLANVRQQLDQTGMTAEDALGAVAPEVTEDELVATLELIGRRVDRLGAINLAAIEEFEEQSERKQYLDKQHADLEEALDTLNAAIKRIDRETRSRFKATYDEVNGHLKTIFPKVFGGGHAQLELTGEDLLDTGITLMARPPGKRNANIHLLSGGEKAMTAVALVFAIFQLNPSPVCLLDEVDAPLDDANVVRFADLIEEMSSEVQFVVITHNKLTMEMADHLLGVTMNEPGVSRLVSVDVEQAAEMAVG